MKVHELKTDPNVFQASMEGIKPWEMRFDDRDFEVDDMLLLLETKFTGEEMSQGKPLIYTGRRLELFVNYILKGPIYGLKDGWVVMSVQHN